MRKKTATSFKMPHTYVIIFGMVLLTALLANIVPAGEFTRVLDEASGKMVVVADSFHYLPKTGCSLFEIFTSIQLGFICLRLCLYVIEKRNVRCGRRRRFAKDRQSRTPVDSDLHDRLRDPRLNHRSV